MQILGAVHFEKCLPESFNGISATTSRMALRDALINQREPARFAKMYMNELEGIIRRLERSSNVHLREQPIFEWYINSEPHFSPCWQFEHVMVLRCISLHLLSEGRSQLLESNFKEAKRLFEEAGQVCKKAREGPVRKWSFKDMPYLLCCHDDFWEAEEKRCQSYCYLSSFQFAIASGHAESSSSTNILKIVCKKLLASTELCLTQGTDVENMYDLAVLLKAYIHAQALWSEGNYPDALAVTDYETVPKPEMAEAHVILQWMKSREDIFQMWRQECANVHFVTKSRELPEIPFD
jgi:hypothetical protein